MHIKDENTLVRVCYPKYLNWGEDFNELLKGIGYCRQITFSTTQMIVFLKSLSSCLPLINSTGASGLNSQKTDIYFLIYFYGLLCSV